MTAPERSDTGADDRGDPEESQPDPDTGDALAFPYEDLWYIKTRGRYALVP